MYFQEPWGNIILNLTGTNCAKNYLLPHKTSHHMEILIVLDQFINNVQQQKKKRSSFCQKIHHQGQKNVRRHQRKGTRSSTICVETRKVCALSTNKKQPIRFPYRIGEEKLKRMMIQCSYALPRPPTE
jgi:hypothetical protein